MKFYTESNPGNIFPRIQQNCKAVAKRGETKKSRKKIILDCILKIRGKQR